MLRTSSRRALAALLLATSSACVGTYEDLASLDAGDEAALDANDERPRDALDVSDAADVRDASDASDALDVSDVSDALDASDALDVSDVLDASDAPDAADPSDASDASHDVVDAPLPEPDFTSIAWDSPGYGVFYRDSQNPRGNDVFIGYAGYGVQAPWAQAWVTQLYLDALRARGVRHVYSVQGPRDSLYNAQEIGNSRLIAHMLPRLAAGARILAVAHSSGGFVASEFIVQLYGRGLDPMHLTSGRISYWDLDGGAVGLNATIVGQLHRAWFVWASASGVQSPNASVMRSLGATYASAGGALMIDASASGCRASWCVHMALINDRPHNPDASSAMADYAMFDATHTVATSYLARTSFGAP